MSCWAKYNANPKNKNVGDCVIRALAKATGQDWDRVFAGLVVEAYEQADMPSANHVWGAYLKKRGFKRYIIPNTCPDCYTVADFCTDHPHGTYVLALAGHVIAVQYGRSFDTWDSSGSVPLYYWTNEEE